MPCRLSVGIEGLVGAWDAARGAVGRLDNACRAELMASVGRPLVVGEEVVVAESRTTVLHGAAGMDQDLLPGLLGTEPGHLPIGGAAARANAALLLFGGKLRAPRGVIVDPIAVVGLRPAGGGGVGDGKGRFDGKSPADPRVGKRGA